jgi:hypothetical protein
VLPENDAFPSYTAVMECVPTPRAVVVNVATSSVSVALPSVAFLFLNLTVPLGVPLNSGATVAVKVTDCPKVEGFSDEVNVTVLVAGFTT